MVPCFLLGIINITDLFFFFFFNQVHMEADRKAMPVDSNIVSAPHFQERITYKVGSKVIFQHILSPRIVKG